MRKYLLGLGLLALALIGGGTVYAVNPPMPYLNVSSCDILNPLSCLNQLISIINTSVNPQTTIQQNSYGRNILDNGDFAITQRGTSGTFTCGTTGTSGLGNAAYSADRWICDANVTSGAGKTAVATSGGIVGYPNYLQLYRNSGALTQPVCAYQEIPTADLQDFQGQSVLLSAYIQNLSAPVNGTSFSMYLMTGTGSDEGISTVGMSAANAITPAFTGIVNQVPTASYYFNTTTGAWTLNATQSFTNATNASWTRYATGPFFIPVAAKEAAAAICWTPGAETAGTTDGVGIDGVMLEPASTSIPSQFEARPFQLELLKAERYFYAINEPATAIGVGIIGEAPTTTSCLISFPFPVAMRAAPTFNAMGTALSTSTWKVNSAAVSSTLASTFYNTTTGNSTVAAFGTFTLTSAITAGNGCILIGNNGGSILTWSADF